MCGGSENWNRLGWRGATVTMLSINQRYCILVLIVGTMFSWHTVSSSVLSSYWRSSEFLTGRKPIWTSAHTLFSSPAFSLERNSCLHQIPEGGGITSSFWIFLFFQLLGVSGWKNLMLPLHLWLPLLVSWNWQAQWFSSATIQRSPSVCKSCGKQQQWPLDFFVFFSVCCAHGTDWQVDVPGLGRQVTRRQHTGNSISYKYRGEYIRQNREILEKGIVFLPVPVAPPPHMPMMPSGLTQFFTISQARNYNRSFCYSI